jgi:LysM repeat protein
MKYYKLFLILVLFFAKNIFAQVKFVKHIVKKGETITSIANQYKIEPSLIYELNPDCSRVLKLQSILLIPNTTSKPTQKKVELNSILSSTSHEVQSKETLFSIAKQYQISLDELYKANPLLKENGLKAGQKITIPDKEPAKNNLTVLKEEIKDKTLIKEKQVKEVSPSDDKPLSKTIVHEVLHAETKFGIAKQYGVTVTDLDKANPILEKEALKTGQKITIPLEAIETVATLGKQAEVVVNEVPAIKEKTKEELSKVNVELAEYHKQQRVIHEVLTK